MNSFSWKKLKGIQKLKLGHRKNYKNSRNYLQITCASHSIFVCLHTVICHNVCCQVTMLLGALSLLLACLLALLFFKDYKARSRMKLSENIPGPKALPLLGNLLDIGLNIDSKLHMFVCLAIHHERLH